MSFTLGIIMYSDNLTFVANNETDLSKTNRRYQFLIGDNDFK